MGSPKFSERRKPANAELRSAMNALELWIRHAAVKNSGVIKVTHHELVSIHDALVLALREDNPQSLLVLDTDGGTEVRREIVAEAPEANEGDAANLEVKAGTEDNSDTDPEIDADIDDIDASDMESRTDDADSEDKA